jgi:hypothetical protein
MNAIFKWTMDWFTPDVARGYFRDNMYYGMAFMVFFTAVYPLFVAAVHGAIVMFLCAGYLAYDSHVERLKMQLKRLS